MTDEEFDDILWERHEESLQEIVKSGMMEQYQADEILRTRDEELMHEQYKKLLHQFIEMGMFGPDADVDTIIDELAERTGRLGVEEAFQEKNLDGINAACYLAMDEVMAKYKQTDDI
jgi:hypothetical protein